ncbi:DUF4136 domain-containing protein [Azohydromonas australica]|uniref:DUF4136 domain-containing protein n=1 Tax=Azohydromonas australica TaxID=364039 RepID=UPI0003F8E5E3|nr:DUF4136 domain-containing protein [Azohydromonas australica]
MLSLRLSVTLAAGVLLGGCASLNQVSSDVVGYGAWPSGRAPGSYVFERLPSQQAELTLQQQLEDAARPALAQAGFTPATDAAQAGVKVQISMRNVRYDRLDYWGPWGGPWGPGWSWPYRRYPGFWGSPWGPGWGAGWGPAYSSPWYEREVSVIIRDHGGSQVLYESHARSDGALSGGSALFEAMFRAALADFPQGNPSPRRVNVPLDPQEAAAKAQ